MGCKIPWDTDMVMSSFTKVFVQTELREHREKVLFEREKALLPATQQEMREENLEKEMIMLLNIANIYRNSVKETYYLDAAKKIADELGVTIPVHGHIEPGQTASAVKPRPITRCIDDKCKGFIMSNNWCCGLCDMQVCKECLKEKEDEHKCLQEDVDTRQLLLNNTKPCPKCGAMISKVDGCNQMWCVMCHTTFDWKSGEIASGHTHNPHYYEWLRRSGKDVPRTPGDVPVQCGDALPNAYIFQTAVKKHYKQEEWPMLMQLHRLAVHIQIVELTSLARNLRELNNASLRRGYLKGHITEDYFKREIFIRERKRERSQALHNVMALYHTQLTGVLVAFCNEKLPFDQHMDELNELTTYCNTCFKTIARSYNVKAYVISLKPARVQREQ